MKKVEGNVFAALKYVTCVCVWGAGRKNIHSIFDILSKPLIPNLT